MARAGMDAATGRLLTGWAHCVQSIAAILQTRVSTRVMRRAFGSAHLELQDRSASAINIMRVYASVAEALRKWEPGFRLRTIRLTRGGPDGVFAFEMTGVFYPRGHLGDYSVKEDRAATIGVARASTGIVLT